jgi:hypothetical protein
MKLDQCGESDELNSVVVMWELTNKLPTIKFERWLFWKSQIKLTVPMSSSCL